MELLRRITLFLLFLALASACLAQSIPGFEPKSIRQFPLDDRTVYDIRIARDEVTTLSFPGPITALEGAGITTDPQQAPAPVLLNYQDGRPYFSVRAVDQAASASLNVIYRKQTYVLRLRTDPEPFRSVTFYAMEDRQEGHGRPALSPARLLGLIDRAKAHHVIAAQHPELVSQIETATPNRRMLYRGFDVVLAEVFRFDSEDTLVFKVLFFNHTEEEIRYLPQALAVRAGSRIFYASISDASGVMPPGSRKAGEEKVTPSVSLGYFAITGKPDGGRNNLSARTEFNVIAARIVEKR
jgi:hypothetical protein